MSQKIRTSVEIDGSLKASQIANATIDTDKFLVSDGGIVKYRTGSEMLSDLGVAPGTASRIQHQVKAGVAINKGQAVYVTGAYGTNMIVGLASNASESTSSKTMGLLNATVAINGFADVIAEGLLSGLNTIGANAGDPVWLGTNGNLIYGLTNKPYAPNHLVFIGIVTRVNANNGEIFVKVQNGFELDELHDVDLKTTTPVNGHVLGHNGTLWVNKTIAGWLGYTPYNASNPAGYISSYTETDTLASVTARGASTSTQITLSGGGDNSTTYSSLRFAGYNQGGGVGYHGIFEIQNTYGSATNSKKFLRIDSSGTIQIINSAYTNNIFNLTDAGDLTVGKIIKSGGTSSQYLMADGSVSTGVSGGVTSFNTRTGAVTLTSGDVTTALGYTPADNSLVVHLAGTETITGEKRFNNSSGIGIRSNNSGIGYGFYGQNSGGGIGVYINSSNNSRGFVSQNDTGSQGDLFSGFDGSSRIFYVDYLANINGNSFVKNGGTSSQFLKADGSIDSNSYQTVLTNPVTGTGGNTEVAFFNSTGSTITSNQSIKIVDGQLQTASLKVSTFGAGMVYSDSTGNVGTLTGTVNALTYWSSTGTIGSLSTGTYPSLTEISYVKGVTSSIQTQLNGKQNALTNPITGSLTTNYLPKATGSTTLGNSLIYDNGTNVGIGTTTDAGYKLDVNGTGRFSGNLTTGRIVELQHSFNPYILLNVNSTQKWQLAGESSRFAIYNETSGTNPFSIATSGAATFSSSVTATGFFNSSDIRLKEIVSQDGDIIEFTWKDGRDNKKHIGVIAQEVQKLYPDMVQEGTDEEKTLSVNYIELLVLKNRQLEKRIESLEKLILNSK